MHGKGAEHDARNKEHLMERGLLAATTAPNLQPAWFEEQAPAFRLGSPWEGGTP